MSHRRWHGRFSIFVVVSALALFLSMVVVVAVVVAEWVRGLRECPVATTPIRMPKTIVPI